VCSRGSCFRYRRSLLQMRWFRTESTGDRKSKSPATVNFDFIHLSIRILETGQNTFSVQYVRSFQIAVTTGYFSHSNNPILESFPEKTRVQNCEKRLSASSCLSDCLSARPPALMKQLGSHWTVFHEI